MYMSSSDEEMDIPPKATTSKHCTRGMRMKGKASTSKAKGGRESLTLLRLALQGGGRGMERMLILRLALPILLLLLYILQVSLQDQKEVKEQQMLQWVLEQRWVAQVRIGWIGMCLPPRSSRLRKVNSFVVSAVMYLLVTSETNFGEVFWGLSKASMCYCIVFQASSVCMGYKWTWQGVCLVEMQSIDGVFFVFPSNLVILN